MTQIRKQLDRYRVGTSWSWVVRAICLVACLPAPIHAAVDPPNILLILADDVGQECLGCYGGQSYDTPHLDELARTGMRFRHCYSMPACHPTRLTLLTGRYPFRFGSVQWGDFPKSAEARTFGSVLSQAGYATGVAGKWQLTLLKDDPTHPRRLGFGHSDLFGWHEGPRYYEPLIYRNGEVRQDTLGYYGPDLYVRSLIKFMKANRERPFLAYYPMALCHDVTDDLETPVPHSPFDRYDSFAEMVDEMDRSVGRLMAALDALKLREQTLVLFVGDNGSPRKMIVRAEGNQLITQPVVSRQNGHDVPGGKTTLLDGGTRVPLIANWPGRISGGAAVDDLVDMSDFFPTLLELAGASATEKHAVDGHSFASRMLAGRPGNRQWAYSEGAVMPLPGGTEPSQKRSGAFWVRTARWKLYNDGRLFNLSSDPLEAKPIVEASDSLAARSMRTDLAQAIASLARE